MRHMDLVAMAMPSTGGWGPMDLFLEASKWQSINSASMANESRFDRGF
jgi:hypothetical protein